jgi:tetratricopeptide (TPR) repeat protein
MQRNIGTLHTISLLVGISLAGIAPGVALAGPSRSASAYVVFGTRDENHGRWESARDNFRRAIGEDRSNAKAFSGLGRAYQHLGAIDRAHEAFAEELRIDPHLSEAENGLHDTMNEAGHEKWFAELVGRAAQSPDDADIQATYAEELLERGRTEVAVKAAQTALRLNPKMSHATCVLGRVALAAGHDDEAKRDLLAATHADRTDDDAWAALGDLEMKEKDYTAAIEAFRKAVKAAPEHAEYEEKLATAFDAAGRSADAAAAREQAAHLKRDVPGKPN